MSLPPGFLDELRTRLSLGQVVGRKVAWDMKKSNQGKGDFWAPCPFHQEKSASFHVDDRKGFYYCFGCHAKGDAISFVRETENVDFIDAVKILAAEAGMPMPERDPQAQKKADRRSELVEVMEQAVQWFRMQLKTNAASAARDYLAGRGLDPEAQARWELGFAPDDRAALTRALKGKGIAEEMIVAAGLAAKPEGGGALYDRFRGRIIFPIRDGRGRAIALGGRAMDPNARAKYLNSPETELFDKGRNLYNLAPAREAAGKGAPLVVAEGYMDVIALSEAGLTAAVAPLGTAVTESQLQLMWRVHPEPVIALDGDAAGLRAARRVIDLALPLIGAGHGLRFALMPEGLDPDDLIRAKGAGAMREIVSNAQPMVQLLWRRETEGHDFDSPERRAALDKRLRDAVALIRDPDLRGHYEQELKRLKWELFNPRRQNGPTRIDRGGKGSFFKPGQLPLAPSPSARASMLATGGAVEDHLREAVILATLIATPQVLHEFEPALERMDCRDPDHAALVHCILACHHETDLRGALEARLGAEALETLFAQRHVAISPAVRKPGDPELARMCLAEELAKLDARRGHARELAEAVEDLSGLSDEGLTWRLSRAAEALDRAGRGDGEDTTEYEYGTNGAPMRRDERSEFDALLGTIAFGKAGPKGS
ncbi:DNA primase [Limimaricola sp. G21655-S1]|uniref:DNA primase n=1 Tax=Limimaricola sp. G21655-S1 TaxID=3014768 RepID=UPI0022AF58A4|nr:DNA primase [Limimaricola sp. G21655-S1]MCZ4260390.1 DNA primase [Limimaricola sp. G21655-S1]